MIADSGDFARRVEAEAERLYEAYRAVKPVAMNGAVIPPWRENSAAEAMMAWRHVARDVCLRLDPTGSIEAQRGETCPLLDPGNCAAVALQEPRVSVLRSVGDDVFERLRAWAVDQAPGVYFAPGCSEAFAP